MPSTPQTIELLQMMLKPVVVASPQTMVSPQRIELLRTVLLPQTIVSLQTMVLSQTILVPHVMELPFTRLTFPVSASRTAVGEAVPPLATSVLLRAASTSR